MVFLPRLRVARLRSGLLGTGLLGAGLLAVSLLKPGGKSKSGIKSAAKSGGKSAGKSLAKSATVSTIVSAAAALLAGSFQSQAMAGEAWPAKVDAVYAIAFSGFNIGTFTFSSSVHRGVYVLSGDARVSALLGIVKWQGLTRTAGRVKGVTPKPAAYTFDYRSGSKGGSIKIGFRSGKVSHVSAFPAMPVAGTVPLKPYHLNRVLDPLSALMAMAKTKGANPCAHRLRIFDGKQRFDLILSYAGKQRIKDRSGTGIGYVCNVRYLPIAGYQPNARTKAMAGSSGIRIILRPVPGARLLVPHKIIIPTIAGTATLTSKSITVTTAKSEQIALVY